MVYFPSLPHSPIHLPSAIRCSHLTNSEARENLSPWIYRWFHSRCEASRQSISNTGRHRAQVSSHINHNAWIGNDKTDAVCFSIIGLLDCDTNKHDVKPWISTNKSSNAVLVLFVGLWRFWAWKVCEWSGGWGRVGGQKNEEGTSGLNFSKNYFWRFQIFYKSKNILQSFHSFANRPHKNIFQSFLLFSNFRS